MYPLVLRHVSDSLDVHGVTPCPTPCDLDLISSFYLLLVVHIIDIICHSKNTYQNKQNYQPHIYINLFPLLK